VNSATVDKKSFFAAESVFYSLLPKKLTQQAFAWAFLPLFFTLLIMGVIFAHPQPVLTYLPFLTLITVGACLYFKISGLVGSYLLLTLFIFFLMPQTPQEERLWTMGVLFSHALNLFIFLLAFEEAEACFKQSEVQAAEYKSEVEKMELSVHQMVKVIEEREKEFSEEIKKLKEEAELRKIERRRELKQLQLLQSEIENLGVQKEELKQQNHRVQKNQEEAEKAAESSKQQLESLKGEFARTTRLAEHHLEEVKQLKTENQTLHEEREGAKKQLTLLLNELEQGKQELSRVLQLYQQQIEAASSTAQQVDLPALQQALARAEGLYFQLRSQFNEKTAVLAETRKALFKLEGEYELQERERANDLIEMSEEALSQLAPQIGELLHVIQMMEREITDLEGLVSRILIP
jgi:hypothetical protein